MRKFLVELGVNALLETCKKLEAQKNINFKTPIPERR